MPPVYKIDKVEDRAYLDWLRTQPCIITGLYGNDNETIDPAHLGSKRNHGDDEALPVLHRFHAIGHQKSEVAMWREYMPDWLIWAALRAYARELYRNYKGSKL